jgi:hypothetical protein
MGSAANVPKSTSTRSKKHAGGRPRACNRRVQAMILRVARSGIPHPAIAAYVGISPRTLHRFLQLAGNALEKRDLGCRLSKAEKELCEFCLDFHEIEANVEIAALGVVMSAIRGGDWRAALTFLERRYPERWARRRIRATAEPDEPVRATEPPAEMTREQLKAELARRGWPMDIFPEWPGTAPEPGRGDSGHAQTACSVSKIVVGARKPRDLATRAASSLAQAATPLPSPHSVRTTKPTNADYARDLTEQHGRV